VGGVVVKARATNLPPPNLPLARGRGVNQRSLTITDTHFNAFSLNIAMRSLKPYKTAIICITLFTTGLSLVAPIVVRAQGGGIPGVRPDAIGISLTPPTERPPVGAVLDPNTTPTGSATPSATKDNAKDPYASRCGWTSMTGCVLYGVSVIVTAVEGVFGIIAKIAEMALDLAVKFAIIDLKDYIGVDGKLNEVWKIVRDFCNLFFIFILLYVGFTKMLGLAGGREWEKKIFAVLLSALLINFSMPIARATVDLSNIVSVQFYKKVSQNYAKGNAEVGTGGYIEYLQNNAKTGIAWVLVENSHKARQKLQKDITGELEAGKAMVNILQSGLFGIVVLLALSFVLFFGAAIVLIRGLVLIFLIVLSPAPALLYHFGRTKPYYEKFMKTFFDQCIFLPAFIFTLYLSLRIVITVGELVADKDAGLIALTVSYIIGLGAMMAPIVIATQLGAAFSSTAMNFAKTATGLGVAGAAGLLTKNLTGERSWAGRAGAAINRASGGRVGAAMSYIPSGTDLINRGASAATLGYASGLMTTSEERGKAYGDYVARRASNTDEAKQKEATKKRVADLKNIGAAQGVGDDAKKHAKFINGMDKDEQKAYYKELDAETRKKVDQHLSHEARNNIGAERLAVMRGRPQDQAALLAGMKKDAREEAYKKLDNGSKIAVERMIREKIATTTDANEKAKYQTLINEIDGYDYETRKGAVAVSLEGDIDKQAVQLEKLRENPTDQEEFFRSLKPEDQAELLNKLNASGADGVTLADRLKTTIGRGRVEDLAKQQQRGIWINALKNPGASANEIKEALGIGPELEKGLSPEELIKNPTVLTKPHVLPHITTALLEDLQKLPNAKKQAVNAQIQAGPADPTVQTWVGAHSNWKP